MESYNITSETTKLFTGIKKYLRQRLQLLKIEMVEKIILSASVVLNIFTIVMLTLFLLLFLSTALAIYLGTLWQNYPLGFLAVAGLYFVLIIIFIIFKKTLITEPVTKQMLGIFFKPEKETDDNEN